MVRRWIAASAVLLAGCGWFGFGSTPRGHERRAAQGYFPAELGPRAKGDVRAEKLQVRVWADEEFQRVTLDWQVRLLRQVERVNEVLRAVLQVELEIVQVRTWPGRGRLQNLHAALFELTELDPGDGADLVIGLITPLPLTTPALHELGIASVLGKHIVLRGSDDAEEVAKFARAFGNVPQEERDRLYVARQRHKEEVLLLHELGHLWGAIHVGVPTAIMQPRYDHRIAGFAPVDIDLMKIALRERSSPRKTEMIEYLERSQFDGWIGSEKVRRMALLTGDPTLLGRASDADLYDAEKETPDTTSAPDPARDAAVLAAQGRDEHAWRLLEPLLKDRGDDPDLVNLSCGVTARLETATVAEALCRRAVELVPGDPVPAIHLSYLQVHRGADAAAAIAEAERRLTAAGEQARPEAWAFLARIYQQTLSLTWAERAAAKATGTEEQTAVPKWVNKVRADFGLGAGVLPPEREGPYLTGRTRINELIRKRRYREAKAAADALAAEFPGLPGPDALLCRVLVSERSYPLALERCRRAADLEPRSAELRVLVGYAAFGAKKPAAAVPHLERAVALDPAKKDIWSLLAAAYRSLGQRDRLADLRGRYLERFGEQLR